MRFKGKTAFIAGGAGGIGRAICQRFTSEGASVVCADISEPGGREVVAELRHTGASALFVALDGGSKESWREAFAAATDAYQGIDVLVTALYSGKIGSIETLSPADWEESFRVTSTGCYIATHLAKDILRPGGAIVHISSTAAHGAPGNAGYGAAKAALQAMSRSAAASLAGRGLRVNVVTPGLIQTPALDRTLKQFAGPGGSYDKSLETFTRTIPMRRVGTPQDIASAVAFLASDEAAYVTGAEIVVDGGLLTV